MKTFGYIVLAAGWIFVAFCLRDCGRELLEDCRFNQRRKRGLV